MQTLLYGLFLLLAQPDTVPVEETWPQWRGPTGDNVSPSARLPTHWSKTDNIAWKVPLTGWGNSTPAIWRDVIFLTTQADDRLLLFRLDGKTGQTVWQREVGRGRPRRNGPTGNGRYHDENNMSSPSPVTDGKHVWAHFGTGDLACFDFDGNLIWSCNMIERYGPYSIWWGHSNSPVLFGDLLLSICVQDPAGGGKNYVLAQEKLTGKEVWYTKRDTGASKEPADSYTTPILFRHDGRTDLIVFGGNVLDAYNPATGKRLWFCNIFKGSRVISSATLAGDTVYAIQGMNNGPLFAIRAGFSAASETVADLTNTHVRWKFTGNTPDAASPVVANGLVFMATNSGRAICVDAATGKSQWSQQLGEAFRATPLVVGDMIYYLNKEGKTTIVEASREFKKIAECDLDEDTVASPAAAAGALYIRTKGHLYKIAAPAGPQHHGQ
jgi:outer membrane protein assembly factor BamB